MKVEWLGIEHITCW